MPNFMVASSAASITPGCDELPWCVFLGDVGHHLDEGGRVGRQCLAQCATQTIGVACAPCWHAEALGVHLKVRIAQHGTGIATLEQAALIAQYVAVRTVVE